MLPNLYTCVGGGHERAMQVVKSFQVHKCFIEYCKVDIKNAKVTFIISLMF